MKIELGWIFFSVVIILLALGEENQKARCFEAVKLKIELKECKQ